MRPRHDIALEYLMSKATTYTTRSVRQRAGALVRDAVAASSNVEVANRLGVGTPTCWRWSTGRQIPHSMFVKKILRVLGKVAP